MLVKISLVLCELGIVLIGLNSVDANNLTCWRCNNGNKPSKICESGKLKTHDDTGEGSQGTVDHASNSNHEDDKCKELIDFFIKNSIVSNAWQKRNKPKGRSSLAGVSPPTVGEYKAFCVSLSMFVAGTNPQIYRDCVRAESVKLISDGFKDMLDVPFQEADLTENPPAKINACKEFKTGAEKGVKKYRVCLCNTNDCNTEPAGRGSVILPSGPFITLIIMLLSLIHFRQM